jgi:heme-degrading monooxygenase HmoA
MIIREWRGRAAIEHAAAYPAHFRNSVVPDLKNIAGFLGAQLSQRHVNSKIEFLVLSRWSSMEASKFLLGAIFRRLWSSQERSRRLLTSTTSFSTTRSSSPFEYRSPMVEDWQFLL